MTITILICTHNRVDLLANTINSINRARRPRDCRVELLVIANACSDLTGEFLDQYKRQFEAENWLALHWEEEPTPGKSHALNRAISIINTPEVAFVDDDHRIDNDYLVNICNALNDHPKATIICGRILPDWDGREPAWVHDTGPYRIYPLPVPRYDQGNKPHQILTGGAIPGGGNLILRKEVFDRVGGFSTDLGPHGHDLGGGEDSDFVSRALAEGEIIQYVPNIIQYHYVDLERFQLKYLLAKSYQRSQSVTRVRSDINSFPPRYLWRKLFSYLLNTITSLYWPQTRFFLMRTAATLGEISAYKRRTQRAANK